MLHMKAKPWLCGDKCEPIRTVFRLWVRYAKMDLLWFLRDTRCCLLQIFSDTVAALAAVSAALLVGARYGGVGGMSSDEILFMCGYAVLVDGILMLFFGGSNTGMISRVIGRGQLDHMLIQPVPFWAQLLTGGFNPVSGCSKLLCGIVLTVLAVCGLHLSVTFWWAAGLALSLLCSLATILAVLYLISCCAFYAPVAAEEISMVVMELFGETKQYPLGGLSKRGAAAFCTVLPVGLAAWFPANVLLGHAPGGLPPVLTFVVAAVFCTAACLTFKKGMIHYEKYGCNRYTGFGHR